MKKPFYGWIIVGVTFLIGATEAGVFQNILAIFMKPMAGEFGWSRTMVAGAITFGSLCAGIASPFVGPVVDRHGPKLVSFYGILFLSGGLVGMSMLTQVWQLYIFFGLGRMIAIGVLGLVISVTVSNWFIEKRGRAMGIAWLGPRAGAASLPPFVQFMILSYGWRVAWSALGLLVFCISAVPALLFLKRRPEDIGLRPDGKSPDGEGKGDHLQSQGMDTHTSITTAEPAWTRAQAVRTPVFWLFTLLNCLLLFTNAGFNFHIFPLLTDRGVPETSAVLTLTTLAVSNAFGSVIWGFLAERYRTKALVGIEALLGGLILLLCYWVVRYGVLFTSDIPVMGLLIGMFGISIGGILPLLAVLWAEFYGRRSLGGIQGFVNPFRLTANATGPIFGALCYDLLRSYAIPFYLFSAFYLFSGLIAVILKNPEGPSTAIHGKTG